MLNLFGWLDWCIVSNFYIVELNSRANHLTGMIKLEKVERVNGSKIVWARD